jgi:ribosomal protein S18 acetylase RimI-like enzyme
MEIRPFTPQDFPAYTSWFEDKKLAAALGPTPDAEWLTAVLHNAGHRQYAAVIDDCLVGVIGIALPTEAHPYYVITDIATHPDLRLSGIARRIVSELMQHYASQAGRPWQAYVHSDNVAAAALMSSIGWQTDRRPDAHGLLTFTYS